MPTVAAASVFERTPVINFHINQFLKMESDMPTVAAASVVFERTTVIIFSHKSISKNDGLSSCCISLRPHLFFLHLLHENNK